MTITVPRLSGYGRIWHVPVSVPLIPSLLQPPTRYSVPQMPASSESPPMVDHTAHQDGHLQPAAPKPRRMRGPSLRSLVKLALACESAEELGKALRRRYERNARRAGMRERIDRDIEAIEQRLAQIEAEVSDARASTQGTG